MFGETDALDGKLFERGVILLFDARGRRWLEAWHVVPADDYFPWFVAGNVARYDLAGESLQGWMQRPPLPGPLRQKLRVREIHGRVAVWRQGRGKWGKNLNVADERAAAPQVQRSAPKPDHTVQEPRMTITGPSKAMGSSVVILGDSHVQYFKCAARHGLFAPRGVEACDVGGATAVGMRNPNAMTNALGQFRSFLQGKSRKAILVLHLGEVDCGYVIWYRAAKYGESVEAQMEQSISAYLGFLDEVGFEKVVVTGATLPTITDTDQDGEVVKARSAVRISQTDRTKLTLEYNSRLANEAARRGYSYAEVTQDVIDPVSGLTRPSFRNRNPFDHHMDQVLAASVWARRLNDCLETLDPIMMPQVALAASADTFVKGIGLHSKDLPHELKHGASKGDTLRAKVHAVSGEYFVISEGMLNDRPLSPYMRLAHRAHWREA